MSSAAGYVLNVSPLRRQQLLASISASEIAAEAVPDFSHSQNTLLVCFLGFENGQITHIARATKGRRAATGLVRLNLKNIVALEKGVEYSTVAAVVEQHVRHLVRERLSSGGPLPPATFNAVVNAFRLLSSQARDVLDRYLGDRSRVLSEMSPSTRRALAYQKDTVGLSLAIAGIERDELAAWQPPSARPDSFLDGLPQAVLREDVMVVNDMLQVPGFELIRPMATGSAVFLSDNARLTVTLANHLQLEEQLGADLIYFNETYRAFVLVQYKAMETRVGHRPLFRFPNAQLTEEITRMDEINAMLREVAEVPTRSGYRIIENPFFLKLCPRVVLQPDNVSLLPGMYIPLDLWKLIELDETLLGPRGGQMVTFENIGRYFENTTFIGLVANGWIGTNIQQADALEALIRYIIESGRSLTIAVKSAPLRTA